MEKNEQWSARSILEEAISSGKYLTSIYNSAANEAWAESIRTDFVNILLAEHQLQGDILTVMQRRGMHQPRLAEPKEIARIQQKYVPL
jgi:hypothetical protein